MNKKYGAVVKIVNSCDYVEGLNELIEDGTIESDEEAKDYLVECAWEDFGWREGEIDISLVDFGAKFESPFQWLEVAVEQGTVSEQSLLQFISKHCDADSIQDEFSRLMEMNGYFSDDGATF